MTKTNKFLFILFWVILLWIVFIFVRTYKNNKSDNLPANNTEISSDSDSRTLENNNQQLDIEQNINTEISKKITYQRDLQSLQDLQKLYNTKKSPDILLEIIKKQAQNYAFNDALENIIILTNLSWASLDPNLDLHVYINSSNITINNKESIKKILPIIERYVSMWYFDESDYWFYQWLINIWNKDYIKAIEIWKTVKNPIYTNTIQSFQSAIYSYDSSKAIPKYYQDWLVWLAALKNWYFTIARKIAIETAIKDEKYILPYQILAYSHFLTNNRETAIEYFTKLATFDFNNKDIYNFLIWIAYYRNKDYTSSTLYLSQSNKESTETDKLRYLVLNYIQLQDNIKLVETRQKLLFQKDINPSDFFLYFYMSFYKSYFSYDKSLYNQDTKLAENFLTECNNSFSWNNIDVCSYWNIWKSLITNIWSVNQSMLYQLAQTYNQSYLFHILWDLTLNTKNYKNISKAKEYYGKAVNLTDDKKEKEILINKISDL